MLHFLYIMSGFLSQVKLGNINFMLIRNTCLNRQGYSSKVTGPLALSANNFRSLETTGVLSCCLGLFLLALLCVQYAVMK